MDPMSVKLNPVLALSLFGACVWPLSVAGQDLGESVTQISGAGSVFTAVTHTRCIKQKKVKSN